MATIKISDLSVGDWVEYEGLHYPITFVGYGEGGDGSLVNLIRPDLSCFTCKISDIHPIPITEEVLEKNGWSTDGMYAFLRIDEHRHLEYYYHEHRLRKYYCGVDEWQNHAKVNDITFAVHCYSVHQLQRALSLANIDKEITL